MLDTTQTNRANPRQPVLLDARCRKSSWLVNQVELANISEGGCCIIDRSDGLSADQEVRLRFAGLDAIVGTVRWVDEARIGIAFAEPLQSDIVKDLTDTYSIGELKLAAIRMAMKAG